MSDKYFDSNDSSPSQNERSGMIFVLIAGLLLLGGNLFLTWKMRAWDFDSWGFYISSTYTWWRSVSSFCFFNILLHLPCVAGGWMIIAVVKYFFRQRKNQKCQKKRGNFKTDSKRD